MSLELEKKPAQATPNGSKPVAAPEGEAPLAGASPKPRYRMLGTLRFLLALMVAVHHGRHLGGGTLLVLDQYSIASSAVYAFFVLSGYVIAEANCSFYLGRPGKFILNRILRIDPPYYAAVLISALFHFIIVKTALLPVVGSKPPDDIFGVGNIAGNILVMWIWYGLKALGLAPTYYFFLYAWTLVVECKFYLAAAIIYWVATRPNQFLQRYAVPGGITVMMLLHLGGHLKPALWRDFAYVPYFVLGMCIYYAVQRGSRLAAVGIAISAYAAWRHFLVEMSTVNYQNNFIWWLFVSLVVALGVLSYMRPNPKLRKLDKFLGDLTYPLYLNHFIVVILFAAYTRPGSDLTVVIYLCAAIVFSYLMSFTTEPFTKKLRDRIRGVSLG